MTPERSHEITAAMLAAALADDFRKLREQVEDHAQLSLIRREFADRVIALIDSELRKLAADAAKLNG